MTTVTRRVPEELDARLENVARKEGISKSAVVRDALEERLKTASTLAGPTAYDLVKDLRGKLRGPRDLSTNLAHLKGLGA